MTTSGSYNFQSTTVQLIKSALLLVRGIGAHEAPAGELYDEPLRMLNMLLKNGHVEGLHRWKKAEYWLFPTTSTQKYSIGPSGDEQSLQSGTIFTQVKVAASSGASSLDVDSTAGMTAADRIGVQLDDGTRQWTTISSVTDSDTVVLTNTLTAAAAVDNTVITYTSKPQRPNRVLHARRKELPNGNEVPVNVESHEAYWDQTTKSNSGSTTFVYYQPTLVNGTMYLWQAPNTVKQIVGFTGEYPIEDLDAPTDTLDAPAEFELPLVYRLASLIEPQYGQLDGGRVQLLNKHSDQLWHDWLMFDVDDGSVYFQPDFE